MMALTKDANLQKRQANKSNKSQVLKLARSVSANTKLRDAEERLKAAASTTRYKNEVNCFVSPTQLTMCFIIRFRFMPTIKHAQMRQGLSREFEVYSRSCMATGCSARHIRDILLLTTDFLMGPDAASKLKDEVPEVEWFARQREAMGLATYVHSFLEVLATTLNPGSTSSLDPHLISVP